MYDARYGTDWETLTFEAAIERAFALGALAELERGRPAEYERVTAAVDDASGAEMVELAYEEGRQAVTDLDARPQDDREAWDRALQAVDVDAGEREGADSTTEESPSSAPPSSLSALQSPDLDPSMMEFPEFLRRD